MDFAATFPLSILKGERSGSVMDIAPESVSACGGKAHVSETKSGEPQPLHLNQKSNPLSRRLAAFGVALSAAKGVISNQHTAEQIRVRLEHKKCQASGKHAFPGSRDTGENASTGRLTRAAPGNSERPLVSPAAQAMIRGTAPEIQSGAFRYFRFPKQIAGQSLSVRSFF